MLNVNRIKHVLDYVSDFYLWSYWFGANRFSIFTCPEKLNIDFSLWRAGVLLKCL